MSCELIGTKGCKVSEGISAIKANLGELASAFTATEIRQSVCNNPSDASRAKDCPIFQTKKAVRP